MKAIFTIVIYPSPHVFAQKACLHSALTMS